ATVEGVAHAGKLLAKVYTLAATNVPFVSIKKQHEVLKRHCETLYPAAKMDLASVFVERCRAFSQPGGTYAIVTPQNWLFLASYKQLRAQILHGQSWHHVSWLGPHAFDTISGEVVKPVLLILNNQIPSKDELLTGLDVSIGKTAMSKSLMLRTQP